MKKLCTILAALTLVVLCFFLTPPEADAAEIVDSGTCGAEGDNLTWTLDDEGTLTISGTGAMEDFSSRDRPWDYSGDCVKKAVIAEGVTRIGAHTFSMAGVTSISIPNTVTSIGIYAFWYCTELTEVRIPESVIDISIYAFRYCPNLEGIWVDENNPSYSSDAHGVLFNKEKTRLLKAPGALAGDYTIPNTVCSIRKDAFMWCGNVTSITIPASVTIIEEETFGYCTSLTGVWVDEKNSTYSSDNNGILFNKNKTELILAPTSISGTYTIPEGVTTVLECAFTECTSLTGIRIPKSLTLIKRYAFDGSKNLKNVYITDVAAWCSIQFWDSSANPTGYEGKLYLNNELLTNLVVPDGVTAIMPFAFIRCATLTSVTLPNSVTTIGACAFAGCSALKEINIPDRVTTIGREAFASCSALTRLKLPHSVISIGKYAFFECSGLTEINIPGSITVIDERTFYGCRSLSDIQIPEGVTSIGYSAFEHCESLTYVTIPDGVTSLDYMAFGWCTNLTGVTIPDSVTSIGGGAFYQCNKLTGIVIPQGVTVIREQTFSMCYKLNDVKIPAGVTTIESWAFAFCTGLTNVQIPNSVTDIDNAFAFCDNLTNVTYCGTEAQWNKIRISENDRWITDVPRSYHTAHTWNAATCTAPKTCTICCMTEGAALGHSYDNANDASCNICGELRVEHSWQEATCTEPKTCTICGKTAGMALGHCFTGKITTAATCTTYGVKIHTCSICSSSYLEHIPATGHTWTAATCITPKTCTACGATEGAALGHSWQTATCITPKTCTVCSITVGGTKEHNLVNDICTACNRHGVCGANLIWTLDYKGTLIISGTGAMDSYTSSDDVPWINMSDQIQRVVITDGVTRIGIWAFDFCFGLTDITIPDSVTAIDMLAFFGCPSLTNVIYCGTEKQWNQIEIGWGNEALTNATKSYHTAHSWTAATCIAPKTCTVCGMMEGSTTDHSYNNAADADCNVCGEVREVAPVIPTDSKLVFSGSAGLSFQDCISIQLMFQNSKAKNYDKYYVEITQITPEGPVTTISAGAPFPGYETTFTLFEQQIVSWSMTEQVTMTLYGEKDGVKYQGASITTTVEELALEKAAGYAGKDEARCRTMVDVLNYGAAVQIAFDHNAANLPNTKLGVLAKYGTRTQPEMTAENTTSGSGAAKILANNISLQDKVEFNFMVKDTTLASYTPKATLNGAEVAYQITSVGSGYSVVRVAIGAANMRSTYTFALYNANGTVASAVYNVSAEAYAREKLTGTTGAAYVAMMQYGDSVASIV